MFGWWNVLWLVSLHAVSHSHKSNNTTLCDTSGTAKGSKHTIECIKFRGTQVRDGKCQVTVERGFASKAMMKANQCFSRDQNWFECGCETIDDECILSATGHMSARTSSTSCRIDIILELSKKEIEWRDLSTTIISSKASTTTQTSVATTIVTTKLTTMATTMVTAAETSSTVPTTTRLTSTLTTTSLAPTFVPTDMGNTTISAQTATNRTKDKPSTTPGLGLTTEKSSEYRPTMKQIRKKASFQLMVISICMVCVLSFQFIFINMLRKAHRERYEYSVRIYVREMLAKQESSSSSTLEKAPKTKKSSGMTPKSTSRSMSKSPEKGSPGFFVGKNKRSAERAKKSKELIRTSKEAIKKSLSQLNRKPSATSAEKSDERSTDLYMVGSNMGQKKTPEGLSDKNDADFFKLPQINK